MKNSTLLFLLLLVFLSSVAVAQQNQCNCSLLLNETVKNVSTVYAGFTDKVTSKTNREYDRLVNQLSRKAIDVTNPRKCYEIIKGYTEWFKDGHVGVWFGIKSSAAEIMKISLLDIQKKLEGRGNMLQGFWSTADQKQQFAIVKDPSGENKYLAVTIKSSDTSWKPGMVKVEFYDYNPREKLYSGMYYQNNFNGVLNGFTLTNNRLDHWFGPSWYRNDAEGKPIKIQPENTSAVSFKVIDSESSYLKLGKFNQEDVAKLDSLIRANSSIIQKSRNLIIDLRGNPGGNGSSSEEMIRLIYTNPIIYPAWQYRSSAYMIAAKQAFVSELSKNDPYHMLKSQQQLLTNLTMNQGQLVSTGDSIVRTIDSIPHHPQRIAFLINRGSGSSAEFFTFEGKQSKKVMLFGEPTAGVMDYGEAQSINLSCGQYVISVPWGRNGWINRFGYRIDNVGFKPDVAIPASEQDWIGFVMKYWRK
ncbi:S41 family peptidase [Pedobacter sp. B4-66]|uniref:S41 family peptidase n=1 Tax=Pedobacter sp. B4-66 TaxID=2817280 RepID=UPI001BDA4A8A|nr:S41 family peptidase [Pedobacter sp. B4-66]